MQAKAMRREFSFLGIRLPDPDSRMTVEDVRGVLSMQYPEIATAAISGPEAVGDTMKYTFERDRLEGLKDKDAGSGATAGKAKLRPLSRIGEHPR
jgi:PRTRC genetic system protein C